MWPTELEPPVISGFGVGQEGRLRLFNTGRQSIIWPAVYNFGRKFLFSPSCGLVFTNKDKIVVVSQQITNQIVVFTIHWLGRVTVPYLLTRTSKEYCRIVLVAFLWRRTYFRLLTSKESNCCCRSPLLWVLHRNKWFCSPPLKEF